MKIGEFALLCGTEISVLRHYDKEGLLTPSETDIFTGYRYYDSEQRDLFQRITSLKKAGFSLKEIRELLYQKKSDEEILALIRAKTAYFTGILRNLKEAEQMLLKKGEPAMKQNEFNFTIHPLDKEKGTYELKTEPLDPACIAEAFGYLTKWAQGENYQRMGGFKTYGTPDSGNVQVAIEVLRLRDSASPLRDNTDIPFEDDETAIGKWEIIGEYGTKEDFFAERSPVPSSLGDKNRILYFLPQGEKYWVFRWTKGSLIIENKRSSSVNPYVIEEYRGERLMFVEYKSYAYARGGLPTVLVLRQLDNIAYTKEEIADRDNIDLPFRPDPAILGDWHITALCRTKEEFDETAPPMEPKPYLRSMEFKEDGTCTSNYGDGNVRTRKWTSGFVLDAADRLACAYEIQQRAGRDYLFLEFKNGDVIFGGFDPFYFVLTRNA